MTQFGEGRPRPQTVPEAVVRTLRHEVGDLLQTVYAAVAILRERLPPGLDTERRILNDVRGRAESCRELLDTVHDLICPVSLSVEDVDAAETVSGVIHRVAARYPRIDVRLETEGVAPIRADARRLAQLVAVLVADACSSAERRVTVRIGPGPTDGGVALSVTDDGPGVPKDKEVLLFNVLTTTPHGHLGPGLALARRLVEMHGGRITAGNQAAGGFRVDVALPGEPPAAA
jgi:signal transduction histidine kinase